MLSGFLDWFENNKVGIIGTLTLHTGMLFAFTFMSLRTEPLPEDRMELMLDVMPEEEIEEMADRAIREEQGLPEKVSNLTSNVTAQVRPYINQQRLAESVEQDLRAMEQAEFDRLAQERKDRGEEAPETPTLDPSKWDKERYMVKPAEPVRVEGATLVEHDLKDRVRGEGKPGYLCKESGRVVIHVQVERNGRVRKVEYDPGQSLNVNDCMLEQAMLSARETPFNAKGNAPDPQVGTISFRFVQQ